MTGFLRDDGQVNPGAPHPLGLRGWRCPSGTCKLARASLVSATPVVPQGEVAHVLERVASFATPLATAMTETHKILGLFWPSETG